MNSSFLYHAWGLKGLKCTKEEYKGKTIILHVQSKSAQIVCPDCGGRKLVKNGSHIRRFIGLPVGGRKVILEMKVQRYRCKCEGCSYDRSEPIPFAIGQHSYTRRFARYVVDLLRGMTLKDASELLGVSWDTIKDIHTAHLERHYSPPSEGPKAMTETIRVLNHRRFYLRKLNKKHLCNRVAKMFFVSLRNNS